MERLTKQLVEQFARGEELKEEMKADLEELGVWILN
jgi:hypothetical protein